MNSTNYEDPQGYRKCLCNDFIEDPGSHCGRQVAAVSVGESLRFWTASICKACQRRVEQESYERVPKNLASCSYTPSYRTVSSRQPLKPSRSRETSTLSEAISNKVEAGNFRAAVRLLCSEETVEPSTDDTYEAIKTKHPAALSDR